jgi:hypothetical protein
LISVRTLSGEIAALARQDAGCGRLVSVPGIGPIISSAMVAAIGTGEQAPPCLHCMIVDLIEDFFAEYPVTAGGADKVDTGEADVVIVAIAKTVAELTSRRDGTIRQQLIEQLIVKL